MRFALPVTLALLVASAATFSCGETGESEDDVSTRSVPASYGVIRAHAIMLAGKADDAPTRAVFLHDLYVSSRGNHTFPEVALHGALWGHRFLAQTQRTTEWVSEFGLTNVSAVEQLVEAAENFRKVLLETNRLVFIDTYTNYHFARLHGRKAGAERVVPKNLLEPLTRSTVAQAGTSIGPFTLAERESLYDLSLDWEQYSTVADAMSKAVRDIVSHLDVGPDIVNRMLQKAFVKPVVHFEYFPWNKYFYFNNFADKAERIRYARESYDIAERVGFAKVASSMAGYGTLPSSYFADRTGYTSREKGKRLAGCPGDANGDNKVDATDARLAEAGDRRADFNRDGVVDSLDVYVARALNGVPCTERE